MPSAEKQAVTATHRGRLCRLGSLPRQPRVLPAGHWRWEKRKEFCEVEHLEHTFLVFLL